MKLLVVIALILSWALTAWAGPLGPDVYVFSSRDFTGPWITPPLAPNILSLNSAAVIESTHGVFNWTGPDAAQAQAHANGGKWALSIVWGIHYPSWLPGLGVMLFSSCDGDVVPIFWNSTYLTEVSNIVTAAAARYTADSALDHVVVTGINDLYPGTGLPVYIAGAGCALNDNSRWQTAGYTQALLEDTYASLENTYAAAFPRFVIGPLAPYTNQHFPTGWDSIPSPLTEFNNLWNETGTNHASNGMLEFDGAGATTPPSWITTAHSTYGIPFILQEAKPLGTTVNTFVAIAAAAGAHSVEVSGPDALLLTATPGGTPTPTPTLTPTPTATPTGYYYIPSPYATPATPTPIIAPVFIQGKNASPQPTPIYSPNPYPW